MNILLITAGVNNDKTSSWLVFSKFVSLMRLKYEANIQIICLSPKFFNNSGVLGEKIYNVFLCNGLIINALSMVNKQYFWFISNFYAKIYSKKIVHHVEKYKIDKLWIIADLLPMIVLDKITEKKVFPYHISVFDDLFLYQGYASFIDKASIKFKEIFKNAASLDTPTSYLSDYYKSINIVNRNAITTESFVGVFKDCISPPKITNKVRKIALTGSIYGIDAFIAFITAVSEILNEERIEFHWMSNTFNIHAKYLQSKYRNIFEYVKIMPFIPESKIIEELQNYDLLYLPMKFDERFRFQTDSSFPSKTHNYLASQIPIMVHTPRTSSLYNFFVKNDIGCIFDTLDPVDIKTKFKKLLDHNLRNKLSERIKIFNVTQIQNNHIKKLYNIINENTQ